MADAPRDLEAEKILERVHKDNRRQAERAARWDRDGRTDDEIRKAYEENMAEKRAASK